MPPPEMGRCAPGTQRRCPLQHQKICCEVPDNTSQRARSMSAERRQGGSLEGTPSKRMCSERGEDFGHGPAVTNSVEHLRGMLSMPIARQLEPRAQNPEMQGYWAGQTQTPGFQICTPRAKTATGRKSPHGRAIPWPPAA